MRYLISELTYEKESFYENILYFLPPSDSLNSHSKQVFSINFSNYKNIFFLSKNKITIFILELTYEK